MLKVHLSRLRPDKGQIKEAISRQRANKRVTIFGSTSEWRCNTGRIDREAPPVNTARASDIT